MGFSAKINWQAVNIDLAKQILNNNGTFEQAAIALGVSRKALQSYLRRSGFVRTQAYNHHVHAQIAKMEGAKLRKIDWDSKDIALARKIIAQGGSRAKAAEAIGVNPSALISYLDRVKYQGPSVTVTSARFIAKPVEYRTLTQRLCGDPVPSRSALALKQAMR